MKKIFKLFILACSVFIIISGINKAYDFVVKKIIYPYPEEYQVYIEKYSEIYGLDKYLVMGVIKAESNYIHDAHSGVARGLMQITGKTALWISEHIDVDFSKSDLEDPETNIQMGCFYLSYLIDHYDNNVEVALAAYNAGMGNVGKWLKNKDYSPDGTNLSYIPFKETREYVEKVKKYEVKYKELYSKK